MLRQGCPHSIHAHYCKLLDIKITTQTRLVIILLASYIMTNAAAVSFNHYNIDFAFTLKEPLMFLRVPASTSPWRTCSLTDLLSDLRNSHCKESSACSPWLYNSHNVLPVRVCLLDYEEFKVEMVLQV